MKTFQKSLLVEAALAGLFAAAAVLPAVAADGAAPAGGDSSAPAAKAPAKKSGKSVHCYGINGCKGKSECAAGATSCKGKNACKGQGWISLTKKECKTQKGSTKAPKAPAAAPAKKA